jgi:hypothetical protein
LPLRRIASAELIYTGETIATNRTPRSKGRSLRRRMQSPLYGNRPTQGEIMRYNGNNIETRTWDEADALRANSGLRSSKYSSRKLMKVFRRFAIHQFHCSNGLDELEKRTV